MQDMQDMQDKQDTEKTRLFAPEFQILHNILPQMISYYLNSIIPLLYY